MSKASVVQCSSVHCRAMFPLKTSIKEGEKCLTCGSRVVKVEEKDSWLTYRSKVIGTHQYKKKLSIVENAAEAEGESNEA